MSQRLTMIETMLTKGSRDPFVWYAKAMELRSLGRNKEALRAYEDVAREFPEYVPTYLMAAQTALEVDEEDVARRFLEKGKAAALAKGDSHAASEIDALFSGRFGSSTN